MAKLNSQSKLSTSRRGRKIENHEGGEAFTLSPQEALYQQVLTVLYNEKQFYRSNNTEELINLVGEVAKSDPKFILQLALYARDRKYRMNMRTTPQVLLGEASFIEECKPFVRKFGSKIMSRADEPAEVLSYVVSKVGQIGALGDGSIPNQLKKAISDRLIRMDEYEMAKYKGDDKSVKLKDVIKLVHPKPKDKKQSELFKAVINDELSQSDDMTWEAALSSAKSRGLSKKQAWEEVIPHMGYMAVLRNLRNMLNEGVSLDTALKYIRDPTNIKNSRQFPFRFFSAYRAIQSDNSFSENKTEVLDAITDAMEESCKYIPHLSGMSVIACDNSGSMTGTVSDKSNIRHFEIGNLFGAMSHGICEKSYVGGFGDDFVPVSLSRRSSIFDKMEQIRRSSPGASTMGYRIVKRMFEDNVKADRILVFTDEQTYTDRSWMPSDESFNDILQRYRREVNPDLYCYVIDVNGYGVTNIQPEHPRNLMMAGWSEKILTFINAFEGDKETPIKEIKSIDL